jgi:hypothetical protein
LKHGQHARAVLEMAGVTTFKKHNQVLVADIIKNVDCANIFGTLKLLDIGKGSIKDTGESIKKKIKKIKKSMEKIVDNESNKNEDKNKEDKNKEVKNKEVTNSYKYMNMECLVNLLDKASITKLLKFLMPIVESLDIIADNVKNIEDSQEGGDLKSLLYQVNRSATKAVSAAKASATKTVSAARDSATKAVSSVKASATKAVSAAKASATKTVSSVKASATKTVSAARDSAVHVKDSAISAARDSAKYLNEGVKHLNEHVNNALHRKDTTNIHNITDLEHLKRLYNLLKDLENKNAYNCDYINKNFII